MKLSKVVLTMSIALSVLSPTAFAKGEKLIATGADTGTYYARGELLSDLISEKSNGKYKANPLETNGSEDNATRFNNSEVVAMFGQFDIAKTITQPYKSLDLDSETIMWVYNDEHGYDDLKDIEGKEEPRIILARGSGGHVTFKSFVREDDGYEINSKKIILVDTPFEAFEAVSRGTYESCIGSSKNNCKTHKIAGTIYVGKKLPNDVAEAFGDSIVVGSATDKDFNDATVEVNGKSFDLYQKCEVTKEMANGVETKGWGNPNTVCVMSKIFVTTNKKLLKGKESNAYTKAVLEMQRVIDAQ